MAVVSIKATYSLDQETMQMLDRLAEKWGESRSGAVRRAVREAAAAAGVNDRLAALDELQESLALTPAKAARWAAESRAMRRAWSSKIARGAKR